MPVSINEMVSTIEPEAQPAAVAPPGTPSAQPVDEESFALRYGAAVRAIVRDELERYLRSVAD